jgi:hypothetical protein
MGRRRNEMDVWYELNIRLQMEALISEREGMIAENKQREHLGQSMAYQEDSFAINRNEFDRLLQALREHG